jgi:hypothetical protein
MDLKAPERSGALGLTDQPFGNAVLPGRGWSGRRPTLRCNSRSAGNQYERLFRHREDLTTRTGT